MCIKSASHSTRYQFRSGFPDGSHDGELDVQNGTIDRRLLSGGFYRRNFRGPGASWRRQTKGRGSAPIPSCHAQRPQCLTVTLCGALWLVFLAFHEAAHGFVARLLGECRPRRAPRSWSGSGVFWRPTSAALSDGRWLTGIHEPEERPWRGNDQSN
jgi:hypothetical protein